MSLRKEFDWYLEHQDELVEKYNGKVLVIFDCQVRYIVDDEYTAYRCGVDNLTLGEFLIQRCVPKGEECIPTYHSRVAFKGKTCLSQ